MPPAYPPKPLRGWSVSCFLTPADAERYTHPPALREEIEAVAGRYTFDVPFRVEDRATLRERLFAMTRQHFDVVEHLARTKPWDLLWLVEIGVDRLGHAFWKYFDPAHPRYEPGTPYADVAAEYYGLIDERLGALVRLLPDAVFLVVSDHGSMPMHGAFCINEWLVERGWLALRSRPPEPVSVERADVDWSRTRAWGWGGYYARLFLNLEGREPQGTVPAERYEATLRELEADLAGLPSPSGGVLPVQAFRPEELYGEATGDRPDLMVYLDGLRWRSAGTLGHGRLHLDENDTGPDDSVHSHDGIVVLYDPEHAQPGELDGASIYDVAPTLLTLFGLPVPEDMEGRPLAGVQGR